MPQPAPLRLKRKARTGPPNTNEGSRVFMNPIRPIAVGLAVLAVALAGCTGGFTVNQTEPIRVQIEGQPQTVVVHDTDTTPQKVTLKACDTACAGDVEVTVQVKKLADGPCRLHVIIQDEDGTTLEERDGDGAQ